MADQQKDLELLNASLNGEYFGIVSKKGKAEIRYALY